MVVTPQYVLATNIVDGNDSGHGDDTDYDIGRKDPWQSARKVDENDHNDSMTMTWMAHNICQRNYDRRTTTIKTTRDNDHGDPWQKAVFL